MAAQNDHDYFSKRADQERLISEASADPAIALTHRRLADLYERRAQEELLIARPAQRS